jgi:hypothetical protein
MSNAKVESMMYENSNGYVFFLREERLILNLGICIQNILKKSEIKNT